MSCYSRLILFAFFLFVSWKVQGQNPDKEAGPIRYRLIMTANTADIPAESRFYESLRGLFTESTTPFALLLNGDLVSQPFSGRIDPADSLNVTRILETGAGLAYGKTVIVPGDRDWDNSGEEGLKAVNKLEKLVKKADLPHVIWAIKDGCPGPKALELEEGLLLITLQTQWWNHPFDKPLPADAECKYDTDRDILEALEDLIDESKGKNILLAGHFPIASLGEYGGFIPPKMHLFPLAYEASGLHIPLPLAGSMYAAFRQNIGTTRDISNARYTEIREELEEIFLERNGLIFLSGHEKNQQLIQERQNYLLNSGAPTKAHFTGDNRFSRFSESLPGVIELDFYADGSIYARLHSFSEKGGFTPTADIFLFQSLCKVINSDVPVNIEYVICEGDLIATPEMTGTYDTTIMMSAGGDYKAGFIKKIFLGKHYRDSWMEPVEMSFLDLDTTFGGLQLYKQSGGRQTKAIDMKSDPGGVYVFRSIDKNPSEILSYQLRTSVFSYLLKDQTTTEHPYGALITDPLMSGLGILHAKPFLSVLPPDDKLGPFKADYEYMVGMLEEKPSDPVGAKAGFAGAERVERTYRMYRELFQDHDNRVAADEFALARLFDIWVGDWARFEDNWKWAGFEDQAGWIYRPIPRDRDHAFSLWDGILPWFADRNWGREAGENFGYKIHGLRSLTWTGRHMDRFLLSQLTREDWQRISSDFRTMATDSLIEAAVREMPPEIYPISGQTIAQKLKKRRDDMETYSDRFYRMLAKEIDVVGSNKSEFFEVVRLRDGRVEVTVYDGSGGDLPEKEGKPLYKRVFDPSETKEIRLFGLDGHDRFVIDGESRKSIRIRVIGGPDKDLIEDVSSVKKPGKHTLVYEHSEHPGNRTGSETRFVNSPNSSVYNFDPNAFEYPDWEPAFRLGLNSDDLLLLSLGARFTRVGFDRYPYKSQHTFLVTGSMGGSFLFDYFGAFKQVFGNWDIELEAQYAHPTRYYRFFGLGNETQKVDSLVLASYYRTRYNSYGATFRLARYFWKNSSFSTHVRYENNNPQLDEGTIVTELDGLFGKDEVNIYELGVRLDLDFRDNPNWPNKGMRMFLSGETGLIPSEGYTNFGKFEGFMEYFATIRGITPITLGLRAGGATSYGDIPFYKQFNLGHANYLRAFRRNRFTGPAIAFFNSDLRIQLVDIPTWLVPVRFGLKGYFDTGRVFSPGENSTTWHYGFGGGIFLIPYKERLALSATVGSSVEESFFLKFSLGTVFR